MTAILERTRAAKQSRTRQESTRACQCLGNHKKRTVNKENKGNKENKENKEKKEVQDDLDSARTPCSTTIPSAFWLA